MEPPDPPPKKYGLKPREFTLLNPSDTIDSPAHAPGENEIHEILRHNQSVAEQSGANHIDILETKVSRRSRDYWWLLFTCYLLATGGVALAGFSPLAVAIGICASFMLTVCLTWIMWVTVDKY
jgi:hypothetical protein